MKKKKPHAREPYRSHELFRVLSNKTAHGVGHPWAFALALGIVIAWALTGPLFGFSDTWQLVINTGTTIVTFLMVFLIQNTQNRDSHALHLKLDELIRAQDHARNRFIALEEMSDEELEDLQREFDRIAREKARDSQHPQQPRTTSSNGTDSGRMIPRDA
jgi:low affinity Fe/Cu permease